MFGACRIHRDERLVDLCGLRAGEFDFGFFGRIAQTLEGHLVFAQVDAVFFFELIEHPVEDRVVEVVAAEVSVPVGREHFEYAIADLEDRNIERTAA